MSADPSLDREDGLHNGKIVLPEPVRLRVIALAADTLGRLPTDEVPTPLRAAAKFTPAKRARLAAAGLEAEPLFRARVAEAAEQQQPLAVEAVRHGEVPAAADPVELAAVAYLLRPDGWSAYVDRAERSLAERAERSRSQARDEMVTKLREQLDEARSTLRTELDKAAVEVEAARAEAETLRKQVRQLTGQKRHAERGQAEAEQALAEERKRSGGAESAAQAEIRRLRQQLTEAKDAVEAARRAARESRSADGTRLYLLLKTVRDAATGLERELALTPTEDRPADAVVAGEAATDAGLTPRGDDPARLDRLLELPMVHLVVDGYNVTKTGYGEMPLAAQRDRLVTGLAALAARTGAEVTVVFDGAARPPIMPPSPRKVRVLFSRPGELADDVIRRLVAAEPQGRAIVVVSSDREVAEGVRRSGAYPVPSVLLIQRLARG